MFEQERQGPFGGGVREWFAVRVRSNQERMVSLYLREIGYEEYSPSFKVERQWSDRIKLIDQPLFPGYVFCKLDLTDRLPIMKAPGVVGLVGVGRSPVPVPAVEVERVRRMVSSGLLVTPWPYLKVGQQVLIERGPLAGLEGILERVKNKLRIVVSVTLLQRAVAAEIDRAWVRPVGKSEIQLQEHRE
ncbi:MAG: UpxY family transcription antiterminator [Bryobacteraceae bacterium]|nr:UpxY family transcription antiterminator [Bryobacteraceae bacterium]